MSHLYFISHPEVNIQPAVPIREWHLSEQGISRMTRMLSQPWVKELSALYSSTEMKAIDGATLLADVLHVPVIRLKELEEMDRDATGFLPRAEFEQVADEFFAKPTESVRGWETAVHAQERISIVLEKIINENLGKNIAVVSHGGVGALALAKFLSEDISRKFGQPGGGGGNYFVVECESRKIVNGWQKIDGAF